MSESNKDELARILSAMASTGPSQDTDEQQELSPLFASENHQPVASSSSAPQPTAPTFRKPPLRRQHLVQTLGFKRTIIPILLTLGIVCPFTALTGFFVGPFSPFAKLTVWWFSVPFVLIGIVMLILGILTMFQVRNELARRRS